MNQFWKEFNIRINERAIKNRVPIKGKFELTSRCNLRCKMCYVCNEVSDTSVAETELSAEEWISLAKEAKAAGMLYLLLTGGEVFLRKDFRQIYEEIAMMGFNISIYTNATMITEEQADWLAKRPPSLVRVTVYGSSRDTYKRVTGSAEAYDRVLEGIERLTSRGLHIELATTLIQENYSDYKDIYQFAQEKGLKFGLCNYVTPRCGALDSYPMESRLTEEQYADTIRFVKELAKQANNSEERLENCGHVEDRKPFRCDAGASSFWIKSDGHLVACGSMDFPYEKPLEDGFTEAWERLGNRLKEIPCCSTCEDCDKRQYCEACPVYLYCETGSFEQPAPYLCRLADTNSHL